MLIATDDTQWRIHVEPPQTILKTLFAGIFALQSQNKIVNRRTPSPTPTTNIQLEASSTSGLQSMVKDGVAVYGEEQQPSPSDQVPFRQNIKDDQASTTTSTLTSLAHTTVSHPASCVAMVATNQKQSTNVDTEFADTDTIQILFKQQLPAIPPRRQETQSVRKTTHNTPVIQPTADMLDPKIGRAPIVDNMEEDLRHKIEMR